MASVQKFGDLTYRTVSPDEIALAAYYAIQHGLKTDSPVESAAVRAAVRALFPVLAVPQLAMLLTSFDGLWGQNSQWSAFKDELLTLTE